MRVQLRPSQVRLGQLPDASALTPDAAKRLIDDTLASTGVSGQTAVQIGADVYASLSGELTVDSVKTAAINGGIGYAEGLLQSETGLPIRLPRKLTLAELENSVVGLIPTDAVQALDLAITVGAQYVASAVTSLLVGAGVGSVVPGLGTIIGIGVALGVGALREELQPEPQPYARNCETAQPVCPAPPSSPPLMLVMAAAQRYKALEEALAAEQARSYCGRGPLVDCNNYWSTLLKLTYAMSAPSVRELGSGETDYYLSVFTHAPTTVASYNPYAGHERIEQLQIKEVGFVKQLLTERRATLDAFIAKGSAVAQLSAADLEQFRWQLYQNELPRAARQYQANPNDATRAWLVTVAQYKDAVLQRDAAKVQVMQQRAAEAAQIAAQTLSTERGQLALQVEQLQLRCSDGDQNACTQAREINTRIRDIDSQAQQLMCDAALAQWMKDNPREARCLTREDQHRLRSYCLAALQNPAQTGAYLKAWGDLVVYRCAHPQQSLWGALVQGILHPARVMRG